MRFVVGAVEDIWFFAFAVEGASEVRCKGAGTVLVVSVGYLCRKDLNSLPPWKAVVHRMLYLPGDQNLCQAEQCTSKMMQKCGENAEKVRQ